jgi:histidinol-phosphate aminotransferase
VDFIRAVVAKAHRSGAVALLDEAYYLFTGQTVQPLYQEYDNVIISRTFSKDLGLAGLRCAYLLSQTPNIESLFRVKPMHEVNSAAAAFTLASLEFPQFIDEYLNEIHSSIDFFKMAMHRLGIATAGGAGNFLIVHVGEEISVPDLTRHLKARKILVRRPFQAQNLRGWVRIGVGSVAQMQPFVQAFEEALRMSGWRPEQSAKRLLRR